MGDDTVIVDDEQLDERTTSDAVEPDQAGENPVPIDADDELSDGE